MKDERSELHASCTAMRAAAARLLDRAQQAGQVRPDLTAKELFVLAAGIAWASQQTPGQDDPADRLLSLLMTGLQRTSSTT